MTAKWWHADLHEVVTSSSEVGVHLKATADDGSQQIDDWFYFQPDDRKEMLAVALAALSLSGGIRIQADPTDKIITYISAMSR